MQRQFIRVEPLGEIFDLKPGTLYNSHASGRGPLAEIITKFGGRVGAWRDDVEAYIASQRRLRDEPAEPSKQVAA
jgi:hypothetical protein